MLLKLLKGLAIIVVLAAIAVVAGMVIPRPWRAPPPETTSATDRILVLSNPIHTDVAIPATPDILKRFSFLADAGLDLGNPDVRYIIFGWGGRAFYTETPTWADLKPMPVFKSLTLDSAVMHVQLAGDIPLDHPDVTPIDVSAAGFARLSDYIASSFTDGDEKPVPLGFSYGQGDAFFEGQGRFNALAGCNTWTGAGLREAGIATGLWTPLPWLLRISLRLHNPPGAFRPGKEVTG